ncbi:MAG: hypothetical protein JEZ11_14945 [Desulfobacterales bacterium]|nr:hypothetical protein [Desulfobacterales bacterium]
MAYSLFKKTLDGQGYLPENQSIRENVRLLEAEYGIDKMELLNAQFFLMLRKGLARKYRPERALSTFVTYCIFYGLKEQLRNEKIRRQLITSLEELQQNSASGRIGISIVFLERLGIDGLVDSVTPEDIIIGKQLLALIIDHFGIGDTQVVLGFKSRKEEAERLGVEYAVYRKRLFRKKESFRPVLIEHGYEWEWDVC